MAIRDREELRGLADAARLRPLEEVAPLLGFVRDPADRSRWLREGSVLSVTGIRFFDHLQGRGGGGAIDLVVHARGCRPAAAIRWLAGLPTVPAPVVPVRRRRSCRRGRVRRAGHGCGPGLWRSVISRGSGLTGSLRPVFSMRMLGATPCSCAATSGAG